MTGEELKSIRAQIFRKGPTRVVVDSKGYATTPDMALRDYGIVPDIVYIRNDGWSLGTPRQWAIVAYRLWMNDWINTMEV